MIKHSQTIPLHHNDKSNESKDNLHVTQLRTIFQYLQTHIATASMVTEATGVPQKCICRYKRDLQQSGRLWEVKKDFCEHTGHRAYYLTTDPEKAPNKYTQINLF